MGVVPMKPPNRSHEVVAAEVVEGRPVTKENIMTANTCPTQCGTTGEPKLHGVRKRRGKITGETISHTFRSANLRCPQGRIQGKNRVR